MLLPLAVLGALAAAPPPAVDTIPSLFPAAAHPAVVGIDPRLVAPLSPSTLVVGLDLDPLFATSIPASLRATDAALPGPRRSLLDDDPEPQIIEYSDGYFTRLTIHKYASYLMLPLFISDFIVGQKLINGNGSNNLRGVHGALGAGIGVLFAVNTVTGGLNTIEAWHDPYGRTRRTLHSALMFLADIGFVATAALANERENEGGGFSNVSNSTHKTVALASMGTALLGYSIMLPIFGSD